MDRERPYCTPLPVEMAIAVQREHYRNALEAILADPKKAEEIARRGLETCPKLPIY